MGGSFYLGSVEDGVPHFFLSVRIRLLTSSSRLADGRMDGGANVGNVPDDCSIGGWVRLGGAFFLTVVRFHCGA